MSGCVSITTSTREWLDQSGLNLEVKVYGSPSLYDKYQQEQVPKVYCYRDEATTASSTFCLRQEKDDQKVVLEDKDLEVIGSAIIKYGDSTVIVQHCETSLWLSYKVLTAIRK